MAGIKVVVALVRCAADLLLCDDIDTDHLRFADAEECRNKLPAIISEHRRTGAPDQVVMGRCRRIATSISPSSRLVELALRSGDELYVPERAWLSRNTGLLFGGLSALASVFWALNR